MKTAEEKAIVLMNEFLSDRSSVESLKKLIIKTLKEQDRDTRHACAESVLSININSITKFGIRQEAHVACINTKAV